MEQDSSDVSVDQNHTVCMEGDRKSPNLTQSVGDVRFEQVSVEIHPEPAVEFLPQGRGEGLESKLPKKKDDQATKPDEESPSQANDDKCQGIVNRDAIKNALQEIFEKAQQKVEADRKSGEIEGITGDEGSSVWSAVDWTEDEDSDSSWDSSSDDSIISTGMKCTSPSLLQSPHKTTRGNKVSKTISEYAEFIQDYKAFIDQKPKIVFTTHNFFDRCVFSQNISFLKHFPPEITCSSLKDLTILAPRILDYMKEQNVQKFFRLIVGDENDGSRREELLRNVIIFILRSVRSPVLESFTLENVDDGMELRPGKSDRLNLWDFDLREFLIKHSTKLKSITIRTVRILGTSSSTRVKFDEEDAQLWPNFPNLEEFTVILWEKPFSVSVETQALMGLSDPLKNNYWATLLKTRIFYGELKKLVWMSYETIPWADLFQPVIYSNQKTLETIHILFTGNQCKYEGPIISGGSLSHLILSSAQFASVTRLKSLYLRKSHCFLTHLGLLPTTLEELCLDGVNIECKSLIEAIGKLPRLTKLRLVDNVPRFQSSPGVKEEYSAYGVNENSLKAILSHRQLNDICIWGYQFNEKDKASESTTGLSDVNSADELRLKPTRSKMSIKLRKVGSFIKNFMGRSKAKVGVMKSPVQDFYEILQEIMYVTEQCIIFDEAANSKHLNELHKV